LYQSLSRTIQGHLLPTKAEMRTVIATLARMVALAGISVQAAPHRPVKPPSTELNASPPIELAQLSQLASRIGDFSGFGPENASLFRG